MAKEKTTVTIHRPKVEEARSLVGAHSTSEVIDIALDRLIRAERLRRDIAAYRRIPPTEAEVALALSGDTTGIEDDTDWEELYAESDS